MMTGFHFPPKIWSESSTGQPNIFCKRFTISSLGLTVWFVEFAAYR